MVNEKSSLHYQSIKNIYLSEGQKHSAFKTSFLDSLKETALISKNWKKGGIRINPAHDFLIGMQNKGEKVVYQNSLGVDIQAQYGKWRAGATYLRNAGRFMLYQQELITDNRTLSGTNVSQGKNYIQADYISSFINYKANDIFDFEIGYGRNFIGDGYRSLLLSDFANASPYLKVNTSFWKIRYTNLFASHQNIADVEGQPSWYQKKYSVSHFLDWNVTKWLSVGLFETIIWQAKEEGYTRGFDVNYLNPVIFYRPVEFSVGSSDNALVGLNLKFTPFKGHVFYSQLVFDEFLLDEIRADINQFRNPDDDIRSGWWANKYGVQLGWTAFDLFNVSGLQSRIEFNLVRPFTYAHSSPTQAYSNYNASLAHPLGANFHEFVAIVNYQKDKWLAKLQFNQSRKGMSPLGSNYGDNLQLSNASRTREYENTLTQGIPVFTQFAEISLGYVIKEEWSSVFSFGLIWREQKVNEVANVNNMFYIKLSSRLYNQYWDL